jgi:5-methylcytosine-specific restriction endonuclease McrA
MNASLLIPLLGMIAIIIFGLVLLQLTSKRRRRRVGGGHQVARRSRGKGLGVLKKIDHGAHIAMQHGHQRSSQWGRVEKEHLQREPACVACGYKGRHLQVHHIKPFHLHPQLELDPNNLITLCAARGREHHLLLGHLDEWKSYNEHIRADVKHFYRKSAAQIRADLKWQKKLLTRP